MTQIFNFSDETDINTADEDVQQEKQHQQLLDNTSNYASINNENIKFEQWPDILPKIRIPNAWPNIYENKSKRKDIEKNLNHIKDDYLPAWENANDKAENDGGNEIGISGVGTSYIMEHWNAGDDERKDLKRYKNKIAMNNGNHKDVAHVHHVTGVDASERKTFLHQNQIKSFNEKSRKTPTILDKIHKGKKLKMKQKKKKNKII